MSFKIIKFGGISGLKPADAGYFNKAMIAIFMNRLQFNQLQMKSMITIIKTTGNNN